jgi:peptide/nickel transport system substrate-binding protein
MDMTHERRTRCVSALFAAVLPLAVAGCAPTSTDEQESGLLVEAEATTPSTEGASGDAADGSADDAMTDTFVIVDHGDAATLDPAVAYDTQSYVPIQNVYEGLLAYERDSLESFVAVLATDWDISDDGRTYTFTIRDGVHFHGGQTLTAQDVAYSFWRGMVQDSSGGPQWMLLQPVFGLDVQRFADGVVEGMHGGDWVAACEELKDRVSFDDAARTVTFELAEPYAPFLQILVGPWGSIVDQGWVTEQGGWDGECATAEGANDPAPEDNALQAATNGTGPYRLERWAPGEELSLLRYDEYWRNEPAWGGAPTGPARIRRVVIRIVEEWSTRLAMLREGDADTTFVDMQNTPQVDPLVRETCDAQGNCETIASEGTLRRHTGLRALAAEFVLLNQAVDTTGGNVALGSGELDGEGIPPDFFADVHVRKAFNHCFDWDTYMADVLLGEGERTRGPIIAGLQGWSPDSAVYEHDLEQCANEFKAAALTAADGSSLWDTGFYVQLIHETGSDARRATLEILRDNLARVNPKFRAELVEKPWPDVLGELTGGRMPVVHIGWIEDYHDAHNWVTPTMTSDGAWAAAVNMDAALLEVSEALVLQGISETDPADRTATYAELQQLAHDHAIAIWLAQPWNRRYERTNIQGWYYHPLFQPSVYYLDKLP